MAVDGAMQELLKAGVHFGHQTHRWNPKMRRYIFAERGGIYLIDLKKTLRQLQQARELAQKTVREGESVLFVCTKPQLAELVRTEAERCGAFYVTERWLGGMLTNFQTIKTNIARLKELERGAEEGAFEFYTKKERLLLDRERQKLERYLSGIKEMNRLPGLVYVVDAAREEIAVREAFRLEIPLVAIADTNADPDLLSVPVPGNDDAMRSVSLITRQIADAVATARQEAPAASAGEQAYTYSSDVGATAEREGTEGRRKKKRPRRRPKPEVIARRRQAREEKESSGETSAEESPAGTEEEAAVGADGEAAAGAEEETTPGKGEEEESSAGAEASTAREASEAGESDGEEREEVPVPAAPPLAGDEEDEKPDAS